MQQLSKLKFESGVHRVQRVPATESSGRVHTSTATVAVMPEVDDVDVQIDPKARSLLSGLASHGSACMLQSVCHSSRSASMSSGWCGLAACAAADQDSLAF